MEPKMALGRKPRQIRRQSAKPILITWAAMIFGYYAGRSDRPGQAIWLLLIGSAWVYIGVRYARFDELNRHR